MDKPLAIIMDRPMDIMDIPLDILASAQKVETWMAENGYQEWELLGICSRNYAYRVKKQEKIMEAIMNLRTEINCRIEHGTESGGHLNYVEKSLDAIISSDNFVKGDALL